MKFSMGILVPVLLAGYGLACAAIGKAWLPTLHSKYQVPEDLVVVATDDGAVFAGMYLVLMAVAVHVEAFHWWPGAQAEEDPNGPKSKRAFFGLMGIFALFLGYAPVYLIAA